MKEREAKVEAREADADAVLMVAEAIAKGDVDPEATAEAFSTGGDDRAVTDEDIPETTGASDDSDNGSADLP